jgi:hypothetical protein
MKSKDVALIGIVVFISIIVSVFASKALFSSSKSQGQTVEVVPAISADFPTPDSKYFNSSSVDPTKTITIGGSPNTNPFSSSSQ